MDQILPALQKLSALVFLVNSMLATGLGIKPGTLLAPLRNLPLVLLALLLNFVAAPGLAWLLAALLRLSPGHAAGLMLLGCAAGAPFLPSLVRVARGDLAFAASLMILLTLFTLVFLPVALPVLVPTLTADSWQIAKPLLVFIVTPLFAGMLIRRRFESWAPLGVRIFGSVGNGALLCLFVLLIGLNFRSLLGVIGSFAILAAILHFFGLFALTWAISLNSDRRDVLALGTAARNFGAALVPAAAAASEPEIMIMILVGAITGLCIAFPTARWVGRKTERGEGG